MRPEQSRELLRTLGLLEGEEVDQPEPGEPQYPEFDGGVREPAPQPSDPGREHDETVLEIVQRAKWGGQW